MKKKPKKISNALLKRAYMHAISDKVAKPMPGFYTYNTWKEATKGNPNFLIRLRALSDYILSNHK